MNKLKDIDYTEYINLPEPVGWWKIGYGNYGTSFAVYKKPNRFHRFMTTLLLGWRWTPNNQ